MREVNTLPDVLQPGLTVVFCGTAASSVSAAEGAYYAGPGNRFWPTLHAVGLTPRELKPGEFAEVTQYGIGLTDVAKAASGADSDLTPEDFDAEGFRQRIEAVEPRIVAFNGKRAAQEVLGHPVDYGPQPEAIGGAQVYVLPSTSGAARRYWDDAPWQALADAVQQFRDESQIAPAEPEDSDDPPKAAGWITWELFNFPLDDDELLNKAVPGILLAAVGVVVFTLIPVWGYSLAVMRTTISRGTPSLPPWSDFMEILKFGLWVAVVRAFYYIPVGLLYLAIGTAWLVLFPGTFALIGSGAASGSLADVIVIVGPVLFTIVTAVVGAITLPLSIVAAFFSQVALVRVAATGRLRAAFDLREVWKFTRFGGKYLLLAFGMWGGVILLLGFIAPFLTSTLVLACVVPLVTGTIGFYQAVLGGSLFGAAYNQFKTAIALAGGVTPEHGTAG